MIGVCVGFSVRNRPGYGAQVSSGASSNFLMRAILCANSKRGIDVSLSIKNILIQRKLYSSILFDFRRGLPYQIYLPQKLSIQMTSLSKYEQLELI